jgi:hypothetical protein
VVLVVGAVVSSIVLEAFAAKREEAHRIENDIDTVRAHAVAAAD